MNVQSTRFALGVLVLLHFVLAMAYAFDTPYRTAGHYLTEASRLQPLGPVITDIGAPDERQHVNYVQWILDGQGFPVLNPRDPDLGEHYQAHQPPLFYLVEAGVAKMTGQNDLRTKTAGLILRAVNAVIGSCTVIGVFFLGYWGFRRKDLGLAAAAFAALLPMNLALSGAVSNDPLLYCLCTWCLSATALALRDGWTAKRAVAVGLLMGLAFLTKTTAIALAPAVVFAAYLTRAPKPSAKNAMVAAVIALALALPWWIRNQALYGDPLAMKAFNEAFINSPTRTSLHLAWGQYIDGVFQFTWRSFIGVFGYMDIPLPDQVSGPIAVVLAILALGGLLSLRKPEAKEASAVSVLNSVFLILVLLSFIAFNIRYFQGQARYIFPAIGPLSLGFGLGILYYGREKWKTSFIAYVIVLTALNLWIVQQFLPLEFAARSLPERGGKS